MNERLEIDGMDLSEQDRWEITSIEPTPPESGSYAEAFHDLRAAGHDLLDVVAHKLGIYRFLGWLSRLLER